MKVLNVDTTKILKCFLKKDGVYVFN